MQTKIILLGEIKQSSGSTANLFSINGKIVFKNVMFLPLKEEESRKVRKDFCEVVYDFTKNTVLQYTEEEEIRKKYYRSELLTQEDLKALIDPSVFKQNPEKNVLTHRFLSFLGAQEFNCETAKWVLKSEKDGYTVYECFSKTSQLQDEAILLKEEEISGGTTSWKSYPLNHQSKDQGQNLS
jgi:hypothetical protein